MKFLSLILGLVLLAPAAFAQSDIYGQSTLVTLAAPQRLAQTGATTLNVTNDAVDVHGFQGIVAIQSLICSNSADSAIAPSSIVKLQGSSDKTTWTTLDSAALSTAGSITLTNIGATVLYATNSYTIPGTSFSSNALLTNSASGITEIGYVAPALPVYIRVIYTITGTNAVYNGGVTMRGKRYLPY